MKNESLKFQSTPKLIYIKYIMDQGPRSIGLIKHVKYNYKNPKTKEVSETKINYNKKITSTEVEKFLNPDLDLNSNLENMNLDLNKSVKYNFKHFQENKAKTVKSKYFYHGEEVINVVAEYNSNNEIVRSETKFSYKEGKKEMG